MALSIAGAASAQMTQTDPSVGGAAMYPTGNIIDNAVNSLDHTTLGRANTAAGLATALKAPGPFTVFAPTNEAFDQLPPGTVEALLAPRNDAQLIKIINYHVVAEALTADDLVPMIRDGGGVAQLTTEDGEPLAISMDGGMLMLTDAKGGKAMIIIPGVYQSNGVVHVVNAVLMP